MGRLPVGAPGADRSAVVAVFESLDQAVAAVPELIEAGIDAGWISVAAKEEPPDSRGQPPGGKGPRTQRLESALGVDLAFPTATIEFPRIGPVAFGGWLATRAQQALAEAGDPMAHLVFAGVPRDRIEDHREDIATGRCLLVVHGSWQDIGFAARTLQATDCERLEAYAPED